MNNDANPYHAIGAGVLGPMVGRFLLWLLESIRNQKHRCLWFLSREGYLLLDFYEHLRSIPSVIEEFGEMPPGSYLYSSRTALMAASKKRTRADIEALFSNQYYEGGLDELFRVRCACSSTTARLIADQEHEVRVRLPRDLAFVTDVGLRHLSALEHEAEQWRRNYDTYLSNIGFASEGPVGLVDLGFSGTQQKYLFDMTQQSDGWVLLPDHPPGEPSGSSCLPAIGLSQGGG